MDENERRETHAFEDYYRQIWRPVIILLFGVFATLLFEYVLQPTWSGSWAVIMAVAVGLTWRYGVEYGFAEGKKSDKSS